ncbi:MULTISPECIES: ACP phosphodiesterase [Halomonadaceae]|jgi:acyl carrier protein phosphodiesterase|uniref:ACP phosphodiesterase n=1 Tax=Vreelandella janggokensis TaxID=370767 RepID=A0ABT4IP96_9GAMM|nr:MULTISPECIES: ACP phosphodiesterase [Halomonas]MCW4152356.1 ACP phosphodiesterase [Halomonas sp. 18H]MCZ0925497.1 ACP phosphodiesterase [Halomonas janggokensis]MCZ0931492.1 ACP phosphodiesterase [Halomonas janggokensis]MDR5886992.1 ACP phosphodiesterase [Halomonas janggokensis]
MNFLAHAWLARDGSDDFLYGNLIADGVKGRDLAVWPDDTALGIRHHRRVDAWVDGHPCVKAALRRSPPAQRRFMGIALDIVWDHFLSLESHADASQPVLIERCYRLLNERSAPDRLAPMVEPLISHDWLRRYADFDFTCQAIAGVGRRLSGPNRLAELVPWLHEDYARLKSDFDELWPALFDALGTERRFPTHTSSK